jgi:hypothetical protein
MDKRQLIASMHGVLRRATGRDYRINLELLEVKRYATRRTARRCVPTPSQNS